MKAPEAFRSISEVAATLGVPQHTLRAWEARFPFVKPVKRSDGRRYYRPIDIAILAALHRRLSEEKRSTDEIVLMHRAGKLIVAPDPDRAAGRRLQGHLSALAAAKARLTAILG